jgi:hypothetical protein
LTWRAFNSALNGLDAKNIAFRSYLIAYEAGYVWSSKLPWPCILGGFGDKKFFNN